MVLHVLAAVLLCAQTAPTKQDAAKDAALEEFRRDLVAVLAAVKETDDKWRVDDQKAKQVREVVARYESLLRPEKGTASYLTSDGKFRLMIGASGRSGKPGVSTHPPTEKKARLLVSIAGNGGSQTGMRVGNGGGAHAHNLAGGVLVIDGLGGAPSLPGESAGGGGGGTTCLGTKGSVSVVGEKCTMYDFNAFKTLMQELQSELGDR